MPSPLLEKFRQAYRDLDLFPLIGSKEIEAFRVDYGKDTLEKLEQAIDDADQDGKLVFSGHRGCGKSTLLARFGKQMMQQGYFVVFFSMADMVEMSAVDHINILYAIAVQLLSKATERQVPIPTKIKEDILWLTNSKTKLAAHEPGVGTDLLKAIVAKLRLETTFREQVKYAYERSVSDLIDRLEEITRSIETATNKQVLVIIDDLDKLDLRLTEKIFKNNITVLFMPRIKILFTIPIAVLRDVEIRSAIQSVSGNPIQNMEVLKFFSKDDRHNPNAVLNKRTTEVLLDVLKRRVPAELIEPGTARKMVIMSGGVIRELVRIARNCCSECLLQLRSEPSKVDVKINDNILSLTLNNIRNDFAASLGTNRYRILQKIYESAEPEDIADPDFLSLMSSLYILEYRNGDLWYDVHPIIAELLKRRELI